MVEKEKGKDKWRAIKRVLNRSIRDTLSTITIPGNTVKTSSGATLTNPDITLTTKDEVQDTIINKNIEHFSAAEKNSNRPQHSPIRSDRPTWNVGVL